MDTRRQVAFGGGIAVAVAVTVACTFAVSNAVELTDVAGEPVTTSPMVIPSATPTAEPFDVVPTAPTPTATATKAPVSERVPAPEPRAVTPQAPATKAPSKAKKRAQEHKPASPRPSHDAWREQREAVASLIARYEKDGDWNKVQSWVAAQGWSKERTERVLRYVREHARTDRDREGRSGGGQKNDLRPPSRFAPQTPVPTGTPSGHELPREWTGSQREQSSSDSP